MKSRKILPPTYLLIAIAVIVILQFLLPLAKIIPVPWNIFGIIPLACGIALNMVADRAFHQASTTVKPFEESTTLITSGVFQFSRHPMYLGFVLILSGVAILLGSLIPYFVILVFVILMDRVFIRVEEQMLEEKFGQAWLEYKRSVRCWI